MKVSFTGDGGHAFKSGIESQMIRAGPGNSLGLISPTGRLNINGPQKIDFHSFAGPINVHALKHIHLRARRGNVSKIIILNAIFTIQLIEIKRVDFKLGIIFTHNFLTDHFGL